MANDQRTFGLQNGEYPVDFYVINARGVSHCLLESLPVAA